MCPRKISTFFYMVISIFYISSMFYSHLSFSHFTILFILIIPTISAIIETLQFSKEDWIQDCTTTTDRYFENFYSLIGGAIATFILAQYSVPIVTASALIGIIGALLFKEDALAIFTGSFVGMASIHIFSFPEIVLASTIAGILFVYGKEAFPGIGGKLGTTAFFGVAAVSLILKPESYRFIEYGIDITHVVYDYSFITILSVSGAFGSITTHLLSSKFFHNVVLASSLVALLAELVLSLIVPTHASIVALSIYCGTFAGMSTKERLTSNTQFILAGALSGFVFYQSLPVFIGFGGKLGISAFVSTLTIKFIAESINNRQIGGSHA